MRYDFGWLPFRLEGSPRLPQDQGVRTSQPKIRNVASARTEIARTPTPLSSVTDVIWLYIKVRFCNLRR